MKTLTETRAPVIAPSHSMTTASLFELICYFFLACSLLAMLMLCFAGRGTDPDIYRMILSWQHMVLHGEYLTSRTPGHFAAEMIVGFLSSNFHFAIANIIVSIFSCTAIWLFYRELRSYLPFAFALAVVTFIVTNPYWILSASSLNDWTLGVSFLILASLLLRRGWILFAAVVFAVATSCRAEFGPFSLIALALYPVIYGGSGWRDATKAVLAFLFVCGLLWMPVLISYHLSLSFLSAETEVSGGLAGRLGRWTYKTVMFFGIPAFVVLLVPSMAAVWNRPWLRDAARPHGPALLAPAGLALLYFVGMVLYYPISPASLLAIVVILPLLLYALNVPSRILLIATACQVFYWFVSPTLIEVEYASRGVGKGTRLQSVEFRPHLAEGVLISEARARPEYDAFYVHVLPVPPEETFDHPTAQRDRESHRSVEAVYRLFTDR